MAVTHVLHVCHQSVVRMGILRSQVAEPMRRLARDSRLKITVVSGERAGERDAAEEKTLQRELTDAGVTLEFFDKQVGHAARTAKPNLARRLLAPIYLKRDVAALRDRIDRFAEAHQPCIVHARSYVPAWAAIHSRARKRFRLVFDPRGALPEELRDANGWRESSMRFRWWKRLEWRILGEADEVIAVSEPMAEHFAALGPRRPRLVRNGVDLDRFHVSARSPGEGEPLRLVFLVGVDVPYQAIERSADLRAAVASLWPGGATLQILSPDADAIRSRIGDKHVLCESPSRNAIPAVLADADIGLISRDASLGSRVACPVKFAEYLASGLPVIAANGIGECDAILKSGNCGVSLNMADEKCWPAALQPLVQSIQADALALRRRAREAAEKHFAWDRYLPVLRQAYGIDD